MTRVQLVAILTDLEWPVLAAHLCPGSRPACSCCDPHRLGMAGAGTHLFLGRDPDKQLRSSPTWNGRCWAPPPAVEDTTPKELRSSPTWNGRCWLPMLCRIVKRGAGCDPHRLGMAGAGAARTGAPGRPLTGLRSSPTWNGRCWRNGRAAWLTSYRLVAILTDLEWPVLASVLALLGFHASYGCDPHRLGMAGAGATLPD